MTETERERAAWITGDYHTANLIATYAWGDLNAKWQLRLLPSSAAPLPVPHSPG